MTLLLLMSACADPDDVLLEMYVTVRASSLDDSVSVRVSPNSFAGVTSRACRALDALVPEVDGVPLFLDDALFEDGSGRFGSTSCTGGWLATDVVAQGASRHGAVLSLTEAFQLDLGSHLQETAVTLHEPADGLLVGGSTVRLTLDAAEDIRVERALAGRAPEPGLDVTDWEVVARSGDDGWSQDGLDLDFVLPERLPTEDFGTWLVVWSQSWEQPACEAVSCQVTGDQLAGVEVDW